MIDEDAPAKDDIVYTIEMLEALQRHIDVLHKTYHLPESAYKEITEVIDKHIREAVGN